MKITIKKLKNVYAILQDIGLAQLLGGLNQDNVQLDLQNLLGKLFKTDNINKFCVVITGQQKDYEQMDIQEVTEIVSNFFIELSKKFGGLKGLMTITQNQQVKDTASQNK